MNLESINEEDEKTIYAVEGEVEDVSVGESEKDFSIDLTYIVTSDSLIQTVDSETMMDNIFSEIKLIRGPLAEGNEGSVPMGDEIYYDATGFVEN